MFSFGTKKNKWLCSSIVFWSFIFALPDPHLPVLAENALFFYRGQFQSWMNCCRRPRGRRSRSILDDKTSWTVSHCKRNGMLEEKPRRLIIHANPEFFRKSPWWLLLRNQRERTIFFYQYSLAALILLTIFITVTNEKISHLLLITPDGLRVDNLLIHYSLCQ